MKNFIFYLMISSLLICVSAYADSTITYSWNNSTSYSFSLQPNSDVTGPTIQPNTSSTNTIKVQACQEPEDSNVETTFTYSSSSSSNSCKTTVKEQCEDGRLISSSASATSPSGSTATCSMQNNTLHFDISS